jgi:hypothetical protein
MAKKSANRPSSKEIEIRPADLAKALEGISASVQALRRLVLKLPPDCTVKMTVPRNQTAGFYWDYECPPPE